MPRLNAEGFVREAVGRALGGDAEVLVSVPDPRPARLVVVERAGGSRSEGPLDRAGVHIQVWAPTRAEAFSLADRAADAVRGMGASRRAFLAGVAGADEESFRYDPDPNTDLPRYFLSYTLTTYKYTQ